MAAAKKAPMLHMACKFDKMGLFSSFWIDNPCVFMEILARFPMNPNKKRAIESAVMEVEIEIEMREIE